MSDRPVLLSILAVVLILVGIAGLALGAYIYMLSPEAWADWLTQYPEQLKDLTLDDAHAAGLWIMIMGIIALIVGIALFVGWSFAWYLAVLALIIEIVIGLYSMYSNGWMSGIVTVAVSVIIALYLFTPKVREHFGA